MTAVPDHWRGPLLLLGLWWTAITIFFHRDAAHMLSIWWSSSTYNHIMIIPPLIAWLVAQRAALIAALRPVPWWPGAGLVATAGLVWMAGAATDIALLRHSGTVLMLLAAVAAALGPILVRALAFPLGYALFLIPFGDEVVPHFQHGTAQMCMLLLKLAGIPASLDGLFITAPSGQFVVAEACSGVMFLVAMAAFATLAAHLCFRSWKRRLVFVGAALATTVIANGLRAFGTILIAENLGHEYARGADHLVYGWVFFACVLVAVMLVARRWFDRPADDAAIDIGGLNSTPRFVAGKVAIAAVVLGVLAMVLISGSAAAGGARAIADRVIETR